MAFSRQIAERIVQKDIPIDDVIDVLRTYDMVSLLPAIKRDVERLAQESKSSNSIHIESPFPLDEDALARIRRIVGNDLAETEVSINKNVLAGFKARYKGKLYDGSVERIIKEFIK